MKKILARIMILAVLAGGGYFAYQRYVAEETRADKDVLTLYGNVDIRQVDLSFRVSGRIESMVFEEGDRVEAGEFMAALDDEPYANRVAVERAKVEAARAALAKFKTGSRPQEIEQARARVREAEAAFANARRRYERLRALVATGAVAEQDFEDALANKDRALANLESARESLQLALAGFRNEDVLQARAELSAAQAALDSALTNRADTELYAPADGAVLTRAAEPGAVVGAARTVYVLSLDEPVWIRVYVPEPWLGRVKPGMPATVLTDTPGDESHEGRVGFISPSAEFTPKTVQTPELRTDLVFRVRVVVEDPGRTLRQGMPVTVKLDVSGESDDKEGAR
jgi:HlyD family secretion protein